MLDITKISAIALADHDDGTTIHDHNHDTTMDPGHDHDMDDMDMGHSMTMYFHTNIGDDYVLFKQWKPTTTGDMIWTCLVLFALAIFYEGLKYLREYLMRRQHKTNSISPNRNYGTNYDAKPVPDIKINILKRMRSYPHLIQTILHVIQFFISYLLMLVFMTYNVYLCISVLIGAGVGYFLFGCNKSHAVEITEHCH